MIKHENFVATIENSDEVYTIDFEHKELSETARTKLIDFQKSYQGQLDDSTLTNLFNLRGNSTKTKTDISFYVLLDADKELPFDSRIFVLEDEKCEFTVSNYNLDSVSIYPFTPAYYPNPSFHDITIYSLKKSSFIFPMSIGIFCFVRNSKVKGYGNIKTMFDSPDFEIELERFFR